MRMFTICVEFINFVKFIFRFYFEIWPEFRGICFDELTLAPLIVGCLIATENCKLGAVLVRKNTTRFVKYSKTIVNLCTLSFNAKKKSIVSQYF